MIMEWLWQGALIDGTVFDSSYSRGAPSKFAPSQVTLIPLFKVPAPADLNIPMSRTGHSGLDRGHATHA